MGYSFCFFSLSGLWVGLFKSDLSLDMSFFFCTLSFTWPWASLIFMLLLTELLPSLSWSLTLILDRLLSGDAKMFLSSWVGGIDGPVTYREFKDLWALPLIPRISSFAVEVPSLFFLEPPRFSLISFWSLLSFFWFGSTTLTKLREASDWLLISSSLFSVT